MSNIGPEGRSYLLISDADLVRLARLAAADRSDFFARHPDWRALYAKRVLAVALCQGAALHYIGAPVGIQDFDVYTFYAKNPARPWYAKRNVHRDFGDPKFGKSPGWDHFTGRRVDLLSRGIAHRRGADPADSIRQWLCSDHSKSARLLADKAVVLLWPSSRRGEVVWS
jgi:hypothetical protein